MRKIDKLTKIRTRILSWGKRREKELEEKKGRVGERRTLKEKVNEEKGIKS